jgi:peptide deformylase
MTSRQIIRHPDDRLRKKSTTLKIEEITNLETQTLIDDLIQTLYVENGVGLAAPQIGENKRIIIVDVGDGAQVFINPKIVSVSLRKIKSEEGCLSIPGFKGIVRRHREVKVSALSRDGNKLDIKASRLLAIVLQHEIDHLDGILFIDKVVRFTSTPEL